MVAGCRLFVKATKHLSFERLQSVCAEYDSMRYSLGVIDLALNCANEWDVEDKAVSYWIDGMPEGDARVHAFTLRKQCYDLVFSTLERADELLDQASRKNPTMFGEETMSCKSRRHASERPADPCRAIDEEADGSRTNAYTKALSVKDEFFHVALYDWYITRGMTDQLLEVCICML